MPDANIQVELRTSPHLKQAISTPQIMRNVVYALLPVSAFAVFAFGLSALVEKFGERAEDVFYITTDDGRPLDEAECERLERALRRVKTFHQPGP